MIKMKYSDFSSTANYQTTAALFLEYKAAWASLSLQPCFLFCLFRRRHYVLIESYVATSELCNKTGTVHNVTASRVRANIVAVEKQ
jgi:hypothetical protein